MSKSTSVDSPKIRRLSLFADGEIEAFRKDFQFEAEAHINRTSSGKFQQIQGRGVFELHLLEGAIAN